MEPATSSKSPPLTQKSNLNILLVYPEVPDTYWSYGHALEFVGNEVQKG